MTQNTEKLVGEGTAARAPHNFMRVTMRLTMPFDGDEYSDKMLDVARQEAEEIRMNIPNIAEPGDIGEVISVELISTDGKTVLAEF